MATKYIVSKKSFFYLISSADGMLDSLGRFSSPVPFSNSYHIFHIRHFDKTNPEVWLQQKFISDHSKWMISLENELYQPNPPPTKLTLADVTVSIQPDRFWNAENFINHHLNAGLIHLFPEPDFRERLVSSNELVAWKVADQLMFMCDNFNRKLPAWYISLKTACFECHIMVVHLKFGLVFIQFYYPTINAVLKKDLPKPLLNSPNFH